VAPADLHLLSARVPVREELAGGGEELLHDPGDPAVAQLARLSLAGLAWKIECDEVPGDRDVPAVERRQPEAPVLLGVDAASGTQEAARKEPDGAGEDLLPGQAREG
jgi:hypothetical protein